MLLVRLLWLLHGKQGFVPMFCTPEQGVCQLFSGGVFIYVDVYLCIVLKKYCEVVIWFQCSIEIFEGAVLGS
jgi:hypothetical protein